MRNCNFSPRDALSPHLHLPASEEGSGLIRPWMRVRVKGRTGHLTGRKLDPPMASLFMLSLGLGRNQ